MKAISKQKQTGFIVVLFLTAFLLGYIVAHKQGKDQVIELKEWQGRNIEQVIRMEQRRPVWQTLLGKVGQLCKNKSGFSY